MAELVVAIDQGTTGTTVLVIDPAGTSAAGPTAKFASSFRVPDGSSTTPRRLPRVGHRAARRALRAARARARMSPRIGITNQRETFVVWERASGRPIGRAIVWQCRRSADICERIRARTRAKSPGAPAWLLDPYFSASKLKWMLDRDRNLRRRAARGELCFGTIDSWLIFKLSGGQAHITDYTNASRTMLFNLRRREWDPAMLDLFGVPPEMLPTAVCSGVRWPRPPRELSRRARFRSAPRSAISNPRCSARARWNPGRPRLPTAPAHSF